MSAQAQPLPTWDLRAHMNRDHQRLNQLFDQVLIAFREGDREQAAALWTQFDTGLRNHFDFEELHLFPQFSRLNPKAATSLLAEHAQMLSMLNKLSIGVDLHLTRSDVVDEFITRLRAHAAREDALLYRWAQTHANDIEPFAVSVDADAGR